MTKRRGLEAALVLLFAVAACDDPVGPADVIAGEYALAAHIEDGVTTPVGPRDDGALLVLHPDRRWVLVRRRGPGPIESEGFGLTDQYRFTTGGSGIALHMFEGRWLQVLTSLATVDGDTLRWGTEVFVRR